MASVITVTVNSVNYTFAPDSVQQDAVRFLRNGSTLVNPDTLLLRRVYPKRQKTYPGNARNNLKTTKIVSHIDETTSPIIWETSVSRRADVDDTDFQLCREIHAQLILDGELDAFFTALAL
jgi:hypothetical protein